MLLANMSYSILLYNVFFMILLTLTFSMWNCQLNILMN